MTSKFYDKIIVPQSEMNKKNIERLFSIVTSFDLNQNECFCHFY